MPKSRLRKNRKVKNRVGKRQMFLNSLEVKRLKNRINNYVPKMSEFQEFIKNSDPLMFHYLQNKYEK